MCQINITFISGVYLLLTACGSTYQPDICSMALKYQTMIASESSLTITYVGNGQCDRFAAESSRAYRIVVLADASLSMDAVVFGLVVNNTNDHVQLPVDLQSNEVMLRLRYLPDYQDEKSVVTIQFVRDDRYRFP